MSNVAVVGGLLFALAFITYFLGKFDIGLCPEVDTAFNTTLTNDTSTSWYDSAKEIVSHATSMKCSGVPTWVNIFIYLPIIGALLYSILPFK